MSLKLSATPTSDFIEYKRLNKKWSGIVLIGVFSLIVITITFYLIFLRKLPLFESTYIPIILNHIKTHIFAYSSLGLFYATFFGSLFFLFIPLEAFYIAALKKGMMSPLHFAALFAGVLLAYSINYFIGWRFSRFSKNLISPKQFYRIKIAVNRFGKLAIFLFNVIGMGSQQLTFVLGVFRYNKTRLFVFALAGQIVKYTIITLSMIGIF